MTSAIFSIGNRGKSDNKNLNTMKTIEYKTFHELAEAGLKHNKELFETNTSYSFRIFEGKNCTELHIYQK